MGELERQGEDVEDEPAAVEQTGHTLVDEIKNKFAELRDMADGLKHDDPKRAEYANVLLEFAEMFMIKVARNDP